MKKAAVSCCPLPVPARPPRRARLRFPFALGDGLGKGLGKVRCHPTTRRRGRPSIVRLANELPGLGLAEGLLGRAIRAAASFDFAVRRGQARRAGESVQGLRSASCLLRSARSLSAARAASPRLVSGISNANRRSAARARPRGGRLARPSASRFEWLDGATHPGSWSPLRHENRRGKGSRPNGGDFAASSSSRCRKASESRISLGSLEMGGWSGLLSSYASAGRRSAGATVTQAGTRLLRLVLTAGRRGRRGARPAARRSCGPCVCGLPAPRCRRASSVVVGSGGEARTTSFC